MGGSYGCGERSTDLVGIELRGHCAALGEKAGKEPGGHTVWKPQSEENMGYTVGRLFALCGVCPSEAVLSETSL